MNRQQSWKKRILHAFYGAIGFLLFVLIMDSIVMPLYTKHGKEYELPDVTEKPLAEAVEILEKEGFRPIVHDSVFNENYPRGTVIRQNPMPYSVVKKGRRVYLVVSRGTRPILVPDLVGKTPQDAEFILKESFLKTGKVYYDFSQSFPKGVVFRQSVQPGDTVLPGTTVNITVSLGPPPEAEKLPNLVGKSLLVARKELRVLGVPIKRIVYQYDPTLVPETVLHQSVPAGTPLVDVGDEGVTLVVSTDQKPEGEADSGTGND